MRYLLFALIVFQPAAVVAAIAVAAPYTFKFLVDDIVSFINVAAVSLVTLALIVYLWGGVAYFSEVQKGETSNMKKMLGVGLLILFLMVSVWGILAILQNTFLSGKESASSEPSSSPGGFGGGEQLLQ